ncbi:hypothetical protein IC575_010542 [Cucumis melo]
MFIHWGSSQLNTQWHQSAIRVEEEQGLWWWKFNESTTGHI